MSSDIRVGKGSRKILTIAAAVLAVALMLAAPLITAVDTDADFNKADVGYTVNMDNPTPAQLTSFGEMSKDLQLYLALVEYMVIFNSGIFEEPVAGEEPFKYLEGEGQKVETSSITTISVDEVIADSATLTINVGTAGNLIRSDLSGVPADLQEAAAAIKEFLGPSVTTDDKVIITGVIKEKTARDITKSYTLLDNGKCVIKNESNSKYWVCDINVEIKLVKPSETKSIFLVNNIKGLFADDWAYKYDTSPVTADTPYTKVNTVTNICSGDVHYTVNGQNYPISVKYEKQEDGHGTAELLEQNDIKVNDSLNSRITSLPPSTDNVTVQKTYGAVNDEVANVAAEAVVDDIVKVLLIAGGVILAIIILVIILIIILIVRKRK